MTRNIKSKHRSSARIATGLAMSALLVLAMSAASARAEGRHDGRGHGDRREAGRYDHRGGDGWAGGYYAAPPVVYGSPYYYPPPVVYGPAVGISLPGVNIGIR